MLAARSFTYDQAPRGPDSRARRARRPRGFLVALLAALAAFALPTASAFGEGSVDINGGPGDRVRQNLIMATQSANFAVSQAYTVLYVYAQAGETIQLGSSATALASNILVYSPGTDLEGSVFPTDPAFGTDIFDCDTDAPGTGVIATRAQELAGPQPNAGGYVPCEFDVTTTGIYPVIMMPPDSIVNPGNAGTVDAPVQGAGFHIAMWDATVRDAADVVHPGRVFANQINLATGSANASAVDVFPYTRTGYEYEVDFFDQGGVNWVVRSDDMGIVDAQTGERTFASFACGNDQPTNNMCQFFDAQVAPLDRRYALFLNRADPLVISGAAGLGETSGYATAPITPASNPLANLAFTGSGGQAGATNRGSGGTIAFNSPTQMEGLDYTVLIDTDRNGTFGGGTDFVDASGELSASGSNTFAWNGQDAQGDVPACGDYQYQIRSSLAEVHFAVTDVENSAGGTQIERLSLPNDPALGNPLAASYNNRDPYKGGYVVTNNPTPVVTNGTSGPGFNSWTDITGNTDLIDTWAQLPEVQTTGTLRLLCADPQVVKTAEPAPIVPGEDATFKLEVKNNGPDAATSVSVADDLPDTVQFKSASEGCAEAGTVVTCSLASLAPGATHTFEIVAAVPSSVDDCIENSATVTNTTFDTNLANNTSSDCFPIEGRSNLKITKAASTPTVPPGGGQVMFTLVVTNDGPSDDPHAKVSDPLAAGLSLVSAEPSQGSCTTTNNTVSCDLGTLKDGGSAQVLVTVNTTATAGCITNTARVRGAHEDPDPADNQASAQVCVEDRVDPKFDLEVNKRVNVKRPYIGQRVTYRILVRNNGPDAAPDAKVTDTYNAKATVVSVRTPKGSCTNRMPITCELGRMEPGESVTIRVVIKPLETGRARNAASATSCCGTDTDPSNNMDTEDIRVRKVKLKVSKVASREVVAAGETFSYRIRVRNPTKGQARNVKVCDRLPSGLAYVSAKPRAKRQGSQRCWTIKRLGAGKSRTFTVTVRAARGANGRLTNTATVTSPDTARARARDGVQVRGIQTPLTG
jgi:uncharacterized repeat protein (TIGR01451 family)